MHIPRNEVVQVILFMVVLLVTGGDSLASALWDRKQRSADGKAPTLDTMAHRGAQKFHG
jgi:hypothetical protein